MPYRQIQTSLQSEDWFLALSFRGRLLFFTLVTSDLTTVSGFCSASFTRLLHDTGLKKEDLRLAISELCDKKKLVYLDNLDLFFLPRFQKWQGSGPKFQIAVNNSLNNLPPEAKNAYTLYNTLSDRVSDTLPDRDNAHGDGKSIPLTVNSNSNSNSNSKHTTVTEEKPPYPPPPARVAAAASFEDLSNNNGLLTELATKFPSLDITDELHKCSLWWSSSKRKVKSPELAFRNWLQKAVEIRSNGERKENPAQRAAREYIETNQI